MNSREIKNRKQLAQYLSQRMLSTYWDERLKQKLEKSKVKTYLVEAHGPQNGPDQYDTITKFLDILAQSVNGKLTTTEEETFFILNGVNQREKVTLFVDTTDPRFWLFHTAERSENVKEVLNTLIRFTHRLDTAWLPIQLLERMLEKGFFNGLGLAFDRRKFEEKEWE